MIIQAGQRRFCERRIQHGARQRGVALILALLCVFIMSVIAAGLMFSTQAEVWSSANYRYVTQSRYVAEAGAEQAISWLQNYVKTNPNFGDTTKFDITTFPAQYPAGAGSGTCPTNTAKCVVMAGSGMTGFTDTYANISATDDAAFTAAFTNVSSQFAGMPGTAKYNVAVQLLSANFDATSSLYVTKWKVFSRGQMTGAGAQAQVQIVEIVDNVPTTGVPTPIPNFNYGVFATGTGCNVITMAGGQYTKSYNSTAAGNVGNTNPALSASGGDVAAMGNISMTNGAYIYGNLYSAYSAKGVSGGPGGGKNPPACSSPNSLYAINEDNSGSVITNNHAGTGGDPYTNLVSPMPSPAPVMASAQIPDNNVPSNTSACSGFNGLCNGGSGGGSGCAATVPPSTSTNPPTNYGKVNFGSCAVITLQAGVYYMDSLYISNGGQIRMPSTGNVVIYVLDQGSTNPPLSLDGGTVANNGGNPNNFTLVYNGAKTVNLSNGAAMFGTVYAPNAPITVSGNAGVYGAVVGKSYAFSGSGHINYDTNLKTQTPHVNQTAGAGRGPIHIDQFSWSAY
jgi:Tfp pilus assembly protein PilX